MSANTTSSRNFIPMANKYDRIVLLVDMDCFYCQVEEKLDPLLKGQPIAVVQYNAWRGGGIIAVNYAARAKGVTRHMRGDEAKAQCPEIQLVKVPNVREKADLTKYREAGKDVANVLQRFTPLLERASVDEAYLDITEAVNKRLLEMNEGTFVLQPSELIGTYAVGFETIGEFVTSITTSYTNPLLDNDDLMRNFQESDIPAARSSNIRLLIGASIASEIRAAVKAETIYECSAGIAHNKILAKLACGMNKPNKQTLLPLSQIDRLFETLPVGKIKGLGAKFGEDVCERLGIRYLGQILKFTEVELQRKIDEKNGSWLYYMCRGIDLEAVTPRFYSKSIGCCKKFPGRNNITGIKTLQHWLKELANEIGERLEKDVVENNRRAKQMVVNFTQEINAEEISSSRSISLTCYDPEVLARNSLETLKANTKQFFRSGSDSVLQNPIKFLGISVGKFETISNSQNNIQDMFAQQAAKNKKITDERQQDTIEQNENFSGCNTTKKEENQIVASNETKNDVRTLFANALKKQEMQTDTKNSDGSKVQLGSTIEKNKIESNKSQERQQEKIQTKNYNASDTAKKEDNQLSSNKIKKNDANNFFVNGLKKQYMPTTTAKSDGSNVKLASSIAIKETKNYTPSNTTNKEENQIASTAKKKNDVKTLFATVLKKQDIQIATKQLDETNIKLTSCSENIKKDSDISRSSPKSFFKKRLRNVQQSESKSANAEQKQNFKNLDLPINNKPPLEVQGVTAKLKNPAANQYEAQIDELDDLINDLGSLQNEPDETNKDLNKGKDIQTEAASPVHCTKRKFNDIMETNSNSNFGDYKTVNIVNHSSYTDYRADYAEFAVPELRPDLLQFITCPKCSAKVCSDPLSLQTHNDYHFAQELSQSQRLEFREQIRAKQNTILTSPPNASKKPRKSPTNKSSNKPITESITKFLKAPPSPSPSSSGDTPDYDSEICNICKIPIKLKDVSEHKDFHVAKDLQRKLNQLEVHTVEVAKKSMAEKSRNSLSSSFVASSRQPALNIKPITQFFTQPNT